MSTRLDIRNGARIFADQDGEDFPSDVAYNMYIDQACKEVFVDLVMSGWPVDSTSVTVNGTAGTGIQTYSYPSPGDTVFGVTRVYTRSGQGFRDLRRVNPGHISMLRQGGTTGDGASEYYELRINPTTGPVIEFFPRVANTYFIDYIVGHPGLPTDSSVWFGPMLTDELVMLKAAMKGAGKEQMDLVKSLQMQYSGLVQKVASLSSWHDMRNPAQMVENVDFQSRFDFQNYGFAGPGREF